MNYDEDKYQNLKLILSGSQPNSFHYDQPNKSCEQPRSNRVHILLNECSGKYDSDDHTAQYNHTTQPSQEKGRQRQPKSFNRIKPISTATLSRLQQSSTNHIFDSGDETTQTIEQSSGKKIVQSQNRYKEFLKNVSSTSRKQKFSDVIFITPAQSATSLVKSQLSTELKQSSEKRQKQISNSQQMRNRYSIGQINTTGGGLTSKQQTSTQMNMTESSNFSHRSPIKQAFKEKLKIVAPKMQITSLKNIPSPHSLKEGINKLISPKEVQSRGGHKRSDQFGIITATQRASQVMLSEPNSDVYQLNLGQQFLTQKNETNYSRQSLEPGHSQPYFQAQHKSKKAYTTTNTYNNLNSFHNLQEGNKDDIGNTFKTTLNLIDMNEMKKFEFKEYMDSPIKTNETKKIEKLVIYKPNIQSLDQILRVNKTNLVQLGVNDFTYFCIRVKGEQSPLRVKINQDKILNYKIMVSKEYPTPSQFNCDYNLQGNVFSFECDNNTGYFTTQEYFYFSIYSNEEAMIKLYVSFGTVYETFKNLREQREVVASQMSNSAGQLVAKSEYRPSCFEMTNRQLKEEVRYILEKRRKKIGAVGVAQNIIQKNIENIKHDNPIELYLKKQGFLEQKKFKIQQAQAKKNFLIENHIHQITSQNEEKEKLKQDKMIKQMMEIKKFQKKTFDLIWLTVIAMVLSTKKLAIKLQRHKERQRLMRDMAFSLLRPFFRYKTRARKIGGQNINLRVLLESKYVISSYAEVKKKRVKEQAQKVLVSALTQNAQRFNSINKMLKFIESSKKILNKFIIFHSRIGLFKKLLYKQWDRYYYDVIPEIIDVNVDQATLKNSSLTKRVIQNTYQSFNQVEQKRQAIENYFQNMLTNYKQKLKQQLCTIEKKPSIYLTAQKSSFAINDKKEEDLQQISSTTSIKVNLGQQQQQDGQQGLVPKSTFNKNKKEKQEEEEQKVDSNQQIQSKQDIKNKPSKYSVDFKLFIIPTREQYRNIIHEAVSSIYHQYPDLQKKVTLKYIPI